MRVPFAHLLAVVVAGSGIAAEATAQVLQLPRARRAVFATSIWAGYVDPGNVADGRTDTDWIFSDGLGWRASLEYGIGRGSTLGVVGSFTRLPLEVRSRTDASTREAEGDILSLEALFHAGGEIGLHQVIEVSAGVREFRNFRADGSGEKLGPVSGDRDLTFALGYGFGFGFSSRAQIALVQDFGYTFHQREGLPASSSRTAQHRSTRIGLRIRLGG
ncbi:MAG TPA: hypothetical protein VFB46_07290 [Gemmatimonadaceae bacterium]|nr:hypothetical protein [Gemmatimonadaceae bacterium]